MPEFGEAFDQQGFGPGLGEADDERIGRVQFVEAEMGEAPAFGVEGRLVEPAAGVEEPVDDAHRGEQFQRAGVDGEGFRVGRGPGRAVDDAKIDAVAREFAGQGEAGRPGADDEDGGRSGHASESVGKLCPEGVGEGTHRLGFAEGERRHHVVYGGNSRPTRKPRSRICRPNAPTSRPSSKKTKLVFEGKRRSPRSSSAAARMSRDSCMRARMKAT